MLISACTPMLCPIHVFFRLKRQPQQSENVVSRGSGMGNATECVWEVQKAYSVVPNIIGTKFIYVCTRWLWLWHTYQIYIYIGRCSCSAAWPAAPLATPLLLTADGCVCRDSRAKSHLQASRPNCNRRSPGLMTRRLPR